MDLFSRFKNGILLTKGLVRILSSTMTLSGANLDSTSDDALVKADWLRDLAYEVLSATSLFVNRKSSFWGSSSTAVPLSLKWSILSRNGNETGPGISRSVVR